MKKIPKDMKVKNRNTKENKNKMKSGDEKFRMSYKNYRVSVINRSKI